MYAPSGVLACNSLLCTACRSDSGVKFIRATDEAHGDPMKHGKQSEKNIDEKEKPRSKQQRHKTQVIENITSDLMNSTESLSDDESLEHFVESIEKGGD